MNKVRHLPAKEPGIFYWNWWRPKRSQKDSEYWANCKILNGGSHSSCSQGLMFPRFTYMAQMGKDKGFYAGFPQHILITNFSYTETTYNWRTQDPGNTDTPPSGRRLSLPQLKRGLCERQGIVWAAFMFNFFFFSRYFITLWWEDPLFSYLLLFEVLICQNCCLLWMQIYFFHD